MGEQERVVRVGPGLWIVEDWMKISRWVEGMVWCSLPCWRSGSIICGGVAKLKGGGGGWEGETRMVVAVGSAA